MSTKSPSILVNEKQTGNPLLKCIKNVKWEFATTPIVPDFILTPSTCALFLSLKYHRLHSHYLVKRIRELGETFVLRLLIVMVDIEDNVISLQEINTLCLEKNITFICAWSNMESARYLETYKAYETKPSTSIQEKVETNYVAQVTKTLTTIPSVNKSDVNVLLDVFGNLSGVCEAEEQRLILCPGIGDKKARRLYQAMHCPFKSSSKNDITDSDLIG